MSGLWKFYFVGISLQLIGAPAAAYFTGTLGPRDVVDWVFICTGVIGLYGYVYKKNLWARSVAKTQKIRHCSFTQRRYS